MIRNIEEFNQAWQHASESTKKIMAVLTDSSLSQTIIEGHRSLGQIAWHTVTSVSEMMNRTGLTITGVDHEAPTPSSAEEIKNTYNLVSQSLVDEITNNWKDETFAIEDDMYGMKWKRGVTLIILMTHQTHHVGQMTVLMRQAGLKIPGVCGPSKEEWQQYGMPEPKE